jgi:hypothetical protein
MLADCKGLWGNDIALSASSFHHVFRQGGTIMLRKTVIALAAVASVSLLAPGMAQARGGHGMGGFHGGFHGGGFHHHGFGGFGVGAAALGLGLGLAYGAYGPYGAYDYYGGPYYAYGDGGCYLEHRRVYTPYGWRIRRVEVCD